MEKEGSFTINVSIAGQSYPILIKRGDEEKIRKAAKLLNETVLEFKKKYPMGSNSKISPEKYLAMAALQMSTSYVDLREVKDIERFAGEIEIINNELENYLKSEN